MKNTPAIAPDSDVVATVHRNIIDWFPDHARDLPWRAPDRTPWQVMVSEFMLQQTPVSRVLPVWERWMELWPTPADLADATTGDAVREWGRLGYPRRALRLHAAAVAITRNHDGEVPADHEALLALPGVGSYTAAAITVFAFGQRHTVIDTNIRRVESRVFSARGLPGKSLTAAETRLAKALLPHDAEASVRWNIAVMELGALVCTARSPRCDVCPVLDQCAWVEAGRPEPDETPRGQSWHGTDRQCRGAIMAVLRDAPGSVPREAILRPDVEFTAETHDAGTRLRALKAPADQLARCLDGLLRDGLAESDDSGVRLPG